MFAVVKFEFLNHHHEKHFFKQHNFVIYIDSKKTFVLLEAAFFSMFLGICTSFGGWGAGRGDVPF